MGVSWLLFLVIFSAVMAGSASLVTALIRAAGRRRQLAETEMQRILEELTKVNARLNDVDERVADMTLMVDDVSRPAIMDSRPERD